MKRSMFTIALAALLCGFICPMSYAQPQAGEDRLEVLAKKLADRLVAKKQKRVTVLDFTDIQNRPNELGRYLALKLANELVNLTDIAVLDRTNLETIMAEHKLTAEGLLRPEEAKKLGQFAGVDAILIGNVSPMGNNVEINVRAISTETSEIVAAGIASLAATEDSRRMLGRSVDSGDRTNQGTHGGSGTERTAVPAPPPSSRRPLTPWLGNVEGLVGQPAPQFALTTVAGKTISSDSFSEHPAVVLNFVAPNCGFCKRAMPVVERVRAEYESKGVRFVNVAQKMRTEFTVEQIKESFRGAGSNLELATDDFSSNEVGLAFAARGFPTMVVVGRSGEVEAVNVGAAPDLEHKLRAQLNQLIAENK